MQPGKHTGGPGRLQHDKNEHIDGHHADEFDFGHRAADEDWPATTAWVTAR